MRKVFYITKKQLTKVITAATNKIKEITSMLDLIA